LDKETNMNGSMIINPIKNKIKIIHNKSNVERKN
jgi:hypothetical protein